MKYEREKYAIICTSIREGERVFVQNPGLGKPPFPISEFDDVVEAIKESEHYINGEVVKVRIIADRSDWLIDIANEYFGNTEQVRRFLDGLE